MFALLNDGSRDIEQDLNFKLLPVPYCGVGLVVAASLFPYCGTFYTYMYVYVCIDFQCFSLSCYRVIVFFFFPYIDSLALN